MPCGVKNEPSDLPSASAMRSLTLTGIENIHTSSGVSEPKPARFKLTASPGMRTKLPSASSWMADPSCELPSSSPDIPPIVNVIVLPLITSLTLTVLPLIVATAEPTSTCGTSGALTSTLMGVVVVTSAICFGSVVVVGAEVVAGAAVVFGVSLTIGGVVTEGGTVSTVGMSALIPLSEVPLPLEGTTSTTVVVVLGTVVVVLTTVVVVLGIDVVVIVGTIVSGSVVVVVSGGRVVVVVVVVVVGGGSTQFDVGGEPGEFLLMAK